ncbi:unnamed protein product [Cuscuta campestris]|uniref:MULE transposase domain-containing protein n=1 Tax=Cuscuta campestris TaxID=132261 RepID=A0A484M2N2_9ASTE|nr:unnamed protein product [Cuscuta campestris]
MEFQSDNDYAMEFHSRSQPATPTKYQEVPNEASSSYVQRHWVPQWPDNHIPKVGMVFKDLDDAIRFYRAYAAEAGFDVRKTTTTKKNVWRRNIRDHLSVGVFDKVKIPVKLTAQNIDVMCRFGDVGVYPRKGGGQGRHLLGERRIGRRGGSRGSGSRLVARTRLRERSFIGSRVKGRLVNHPMLRPFAFRSDVRLDVVLIKDRHDEKSIGERPVENRGGRISRCSNFSENLAASSRSLNQRNDPSRYLCAGGGGAEEEPTFLPESMQKKPYYFFYYDEKKKIHIPLPEPTQMKPRPFLKINRNIDLGHKKFILNCAKANIGTMKSYRLFKESVGGYSSVGAPAVDFKNFKRDLKAYIAGGDAQMVIDKLFRKSEVCPGFRFDCEVDEYDKLSRLFWCDAASRKSYSLFGDVVSFDATYKTNRYMMIFALFTGVDNHKKCVTFGFGILSSEDTESYSWLLRSFMNAMGNAPRCIITHQDPSMRIAIQEVLPQTKHRYCMWHIMNKLSGKVGPVLSKDTEFMNRINQVVWTHYLDKKEWKAQWHSVMADYNLTEHSWFKSLYTLLRMLPSIRSAMHISVVFKNLKIEKIPDLYVTNRWCKFHLLKPMFDVGGSEMDKVSFTDQNKTLVSQLMSDIHFCIALVEHNPDLLLAFSNTIKQHKEALIDKLQDGKLSSDTSSMFENFCGTSAPSEVHVLPPAQVCMKGTGKRIKAGKEVSIEESKKTKRLCRTCKEYGFHDSRNCPMNHEK